MSYKLCPNFAYFNLKTLSLISSCNSSLASLLFISFFILGVSNLWLLNYSYSLLAWAFIPSSFELSSAPPAFALLEPFVNNWSLAFLDRAYTSWIKGFDINYSSIIFILTIKEVESPSSRISTLSDPKSIFC